MDIINIKYTIRATKYNKSKLKKSTKQDYKYINFFFKYVKLSLLIFYRSYFL